MRARSCSAFFSRACASCSPAWAEPRRASAVPMSLSAVETWLAVLVEVMGTVVRAAWAEASASARSARARSSATW